MGDRSKRGGLRLVFFAAAGLIILIGITLFAVMRAMKPARAADLPCRNTAGRARCVAVNSFDLWCRETGNRSGKTVIVLHGGPGMSCHYFQDAFDFLEREYRLILYDQRGSGFSQIKPDLRNYSFNALVQELEAVRREFVGNEKIIIIGHSFGGLIAQRYAVEYPDRVDRMVLISSAYARLNRQSIVRHFRMVLKYGLPPSDPEKANEFFMKMFPVIFEDTFYDMKNFQNLKPGYASFASTMAVRYSLGNYDFRDDLQHIKAKTLILYGEAEVATTAEEFQKKIHELIPGSEMVKFEKSGHWLFLEEPERFQKIVFDFLRGSPQR